LSWDNIRSSQVAIREIANDNTAGAAEILPRAAGVYSLLAEECCNSECSSVEHALRKVIEVSVALLEAQPAMAPLARLASAAVEAATGCSRANDTLNHAEEAAQRFVQLAARGREGASAHAADLIPDGSRVLTHSRSSTVLLAFKLALTAGKKVFVIATESPPMMEGRTLASELSAEGATVALITEAAAIKAIKQSDLVLLGADRVTPSDVVNKIGTHSIALAAREAKRPVHVICDTSKFMASTERFQDECRWTDAPDDIKVPSMCFEVTPLSLFTSIITEHGAMRPEEAARLAARLVLDPRLLKGVA
jgi:translation initiation factor 2B subunit (eIF-2B alpha/beta/delta family)